MEEWKSFLEVMEINTKFWKNKTVFITGHTGFKGSWLSLWLQKLGANVIGYSNKEFQEPALYKLACVGDNMTSIIGDIRNYEQLKKSIEKYQPEIIFHMAAQALVKVSYNDPIETFSTNVMGTVNLFEIAKTCDNIKVLINITSDKCYKNTSTINGYVEDDAMGGDDPYSCSKGCSELITHCYQKSFFNNRRPSNKIVLASARAGNVIGGGDWAEFRIIPDIMRSLLDHKEIFLRQPEAIRPWQFVLEPLHGYLLLAEKLWSQSYSFSGGWNFGPNEDDLFNVKNLTEHIILLWGSNRSWNLDKNINPPEKNILKLNNTKAKTELSWYPKTSIEHALKFTVDWYKAYQKKQDIRDVTLRQIKEFENLKPCL